MTDSPPASTPAGATDPAVPGCDTGPAGRLRFVLHEAHTALTAHRMARARRQHSADLTADDSNSTGDSV